MAENRKKVLSGIKPTGRPHVGNYFGMMKQCVDMQDGNDPMYMIVDYHALNFIQSREEMSHLIVEDLMDFMAAGLDPEKSIIFKQSDVPEHAELAWIFDTITTMPYLMRAHAYKDAEAKNKEISVGAFNYPMLMAADILLYDTDLVPVGQDQKQHVEYARDTAEKFNRIFGETFKLPEPQILSGVAVVPGTDGRKMSKSYGNTIPLFAESDDLKKIIMGIVTDSKGVDEPKDPETDNVFALHKLFTPERELAELRGRYEKGGIGYKESKELLLRSAEAFLAPMRERRAEIARDRERVIDVLREGGRKAREKAVAKMEIVRDRIGVKLY